MKLQVVNGLLMGRCTLIQHIVDHLTNESPTTLRIVFVTILPALFTPESRPSRYGLLDSARVFAILPVVIGAVQLSSFAVRLLGNRFTAWTEEGV